jgi:quercetin dioxygenase-like cupin family protein
MSVLPFAFVGAERPALKHEPEETSMQITRNGIETVVGPEDWFTGSVYIDALAAPSAASRVSASSVHFTPGARTAWHTHPNGQTIHVTEGVGLAQRRGGPVEVIRPGDRVFFEPGEDHWHGAAPNRFMTHISMLDVDDEGYPATWGDQVTDDEYAAAPPLDD